MWPWDKIIVNHKIENTFQETLFSQLTGSEYTHQNLVNICPNARVVTKAYLSHDDTQRIYIAHYTDIDGATSHVTRVTFLSVP